MRFQLTPRSMTLDNLDFRPAISLNFLGISLHFADFGANV